MLKSCSQESPSERRELFEFQLPMLQLHSIDQLGFRRVGASRCFALASDPAHGSHSIASNNDYDPQKPDFESMDDGDDPDDDRGSFFGGEAHQLKL